MSRVDFKSFALYRAATAGMTGGGATFSCPGCGKFRMIVGRKSIPHVGRAKKWLCAECYANHLKKD